MKSNLEILKSLGRKLFIYEDVVNQAPQLIRKGKLEFFTLEKHISDNELEKEYEARGLVSASFLELCEYAKKNPEFADNKSIGTHWKNADGKWCFATFDRRDDERYVNVDRRNDDDWNGLWWFCGIKTEPFNKPKPALILGEEEIIKTRLLPQIEQTEGCWNWSGVVSKGYGLIKVHSRSIRVHRLMYEVFVGVIPEGMVIDHLCRNKKCVNPEHLEVVTSRENTLRGNGPTSRKAKAKLV